MRLQINAYDRDLEAVRRVLGDRVVNVGWRILDAYVEEDDLETLEQTFAEKLKDVSFVGSLLLPRYMFSFTVTNGVMSPRFSEISYFDVEFDVWGLDLHDLRPGHQLGFERYAHIVKEPYHYKYRGRLINTLPNLLGYIGYYVLRSTTIVGMRAVFRKNGKFVGWSQMKDGYIVTRFDDNVPEVEIPELLKTNTPKARKAIERLEAAKDHALRNSVDFILRRAKARSLPVLPINRCMYNNSQLVVETKPFGGKLLFKSGACSANGCIRKKPPQTLNTYLNNGVVPSSDANNDCNTFKGWRVGPPGIREGDLLTPIPGRI